MQMRKYLIILGIAWFPLAAQADMFAPSHSCRKPLKPYEAASEWEVSQFKDDVERYKRCISDFVDEQNDHAEKHQEAAQGAVDEWDRFVRYELD